MTISSSSFIRQESSAVMRVLESRRGYDLNHTTAQEWARDIHHASDYINDMSDSDFSLLLEIVCKLPDSHPLRVRLVDEIEGML